jgi:putative transcriptional regulator
LPARDTSRAGENAGVPSLRGQLLVAGPALEDPNFRRTVVLVGEHGDEGSMGIVLNRVSGVPVADAVPPMSPLTGPDEPVYLGGPVQPQAVVVLADFADPAGADLVVGSVGFLPGEIEDVTALGELRRVRVFAGYAGWAPGQLEGELEERSWIVLDAQASDVFTEAPERLWGEVLRRGGPAHAVLALLPDDPRVN